MSADHGDPVLEVLFSPFESGALSWPARDGVLFLRARDGDALRRAPHPGLICEQSFAPAAWALRRSGFIVRDPFDDGTGGDGPELEPYPLVLVLPPRQRVEARALFARAVAQCAPEGMVVACMANDEGAKSGEADLKALAGSSGGASKRHCRTFWTQIATDRIDHALLAAWAAADAPRPIADGRFFSRPGVFAWDRVDAASALLAGHLPDDLCGRAADLGAGYGFLSVELLQRCPGIVALDLYEAEARALALARRNLQPFASACALEFHWHDVACGLSQRYDTIVSNPPFHAQGRTDRPDIGRAFIAAAADALNPDGRLWLVANRHLPYEQTLQTRFARVRTVAQQAGFKVIEAANPTKHTKQ
jgi:16S rRNA (guanine1207-N2)-methyltransferase